MTSSNVIHSGKFPGTVKSDMPCRLSSSCIMGDVCASGGAPIASRVVGSGEHLFRAGDEFKSVYVVRSGVIKTSITSLSGQEQVIGFHYEGDLIGLDAAGAGRQICDAIALDAVSVCSVSFEQLCEMASGHPALCARLMRNVSRGMERNERQLMTVGHLGAMQRMASFLLEQSQGNVERGQPADEFVLPMSRGDIGRYLGMAIETVSRLLTRLRKSDVIAVEGTVIAILDVEGLESIAAGDDCESTEHSRTTSRRQKAMRTEHMQMSA